MYARSPTATFGEPVLLSTGKFVARIDATDKETQSFTILDPRIARNVPTVNPPSVAEEVNTPNYNVGPPKNHISDLHSDTPTPATFPCLRTRFLNRSVSWFQWPFGSNSLDWRSRDGYFCRRSQDVAVFRNQFPKFEMLDAKIACSLKEIVRHSNFKKKGLSGSAEGPKRMTDSFTTDRSLLWSMIISGVTGTHVAVLDYCDLFGISFTWRRR